jgi:nicotinamide riboside kinase
MSTSPPYPSFIDGRRLLLTGSQGTGKSTLGRQLARRWGVPLVAEQAREVLGQWGLGQAEIPTLAPKHRCQLQLEMLDRQSLAIGQYATCVADRSGYLDGWIYALQQLGQDPVALAYYEVGALLETLRECARVDRHRWHQVILVPPNIPYVADGVRSPNPYERELSHGLFKGYLHEFGYPYYELTSSSPECRYLEVCELLAVPPELRDREYTHLEEICP